MKILDGFCGVGGGTRGYQLAGAHVTGVDITEQPNYIGDDFIQADAINFITEHGAEFDFIHTSPPCQKYSVLRALNKHRDYPDLIAPTRAALINIGRPYVIENVPNAPLRADFLLCGEMFGLKVIRHRRFEVSWPAIWIDHVPHRPEGTYGWNHYYFNEDGYYIAIYGSGYNPVSDWQKAMQIDWTDEKYEISQAIPPAYTEFILNDWINWNEEGCPPATFEQTC